MVMQACSQACMAHTEASMVRAIYMAPAEAACMAATGILQIASRSGLPHRSCYYNISTLTQGCAGWSMSP